MTLLDASAVPFSTRMTVRPRHCDAQGMLHAARFYEYFEEAFLRWLADHSVSYGSLRQDGIDLVIVESGCVHLHPARLEEELELMVIPAARSSKAIHVMFEVRHRGSPIAVGHATYVAVADGHATQMPIGLRDAVALGEAAEQP